MLILSRRRAESIMIGEDVQITVVSIKGNKIELGIAARKSIPVYRQEVYDAIHQRAGVGAERCVPDAYEMAPGMYY